MVKSVPLVDFAGTAGAGLPSACLWSTGWGKRWFFESCKPDSVPAEAGDIHLSDATHPGSLDGPPDPLFRLAPAGVYLAPIGRPPAGGLLPHLFTLTPPKRGGLFLWHSAVTPGLPESASACTEQPALWCPDFPPGDRSHRANVHSQKTRRTLAPCAVHGKLDAEGFQEAGTGSETGSVEAASGTAAVAGSPAPD